MYLISIVTKQLRLNFICEAWIASALIYHPSDRIKQVVLDTSLICYHRCTLRAQQCLWDQPPPPSQWLLPDKSSRRHPWASTLHACNLTTSKKARPTSDFFARKERHLFLALSGADNYYYVGTYLRSISWWGVSMGRVASLYFLLEWYWLADCSLVNSLPERRIVATLLQSTKKREEVSKGQTHLLEIPDLGKIYTKTIDFRSSLVHQRIQSNRTNFKTPPPPI